MTDHRRAPARAGYGLALVLALATLVGCAKHSELTVEGVQPGPAAQQLSKLLAMLDNDADPAMHGVDKGMRVVFKHELTPDERKQLTEALERLAKGKPVQGAPIVLRVTETKEPILARMGLKPGGKNEIPRLSPRCQRSQSSVRSVRVKRRWNRFDMSVIYLEEAMH